MKNHEDTLRHYFILFWGFYGTVLPKSIAEGVLQSCHRDGADGDDDVLRWQFEIGRQHTWTARRMEPK